MRIVKDGPEERAEIVNEDGTVAFRPIIHHRGAINRDGYQVLPTTSLIVCSPEMMFLYEVDGLTLPDPRSLLINDDTLVFSQGATVLADFNPLTADQTNAWVTGQRLVFCLDLKTGRLIWGGSEIQVGTPIALQGDQLISLRAEEPRALLFQTKGRVKFQLTKRSVRKILDSSIERFDFDVEIGNWIYSGLREAIMGIVPIDHISCEWTGKTPTSFAINGKDILRSGIHVEDTSK